MTEDGTSLWVHLVLVRSGGAISVAALTPMRDAAFGGSVLDREVVGGGGTKVPLSVTKGDLPSRGFLFPGG